MNGGPSLDAVELMINISGQYPLIYNFMLVMAALFGFVAGGYVLILLLKVHVFRSISAEQFSWGQAIPALIISACLMAFTTTMYLATGSLLDHGHGSLFPPEVIDPSLRSTPARLLGMFAEQTCRFFGFLFGLWGLIDMYVSRMPDGDKSKIWTGLVRLSLGAMLILARESGNLFGGMGNAVFG